MPNKRIKKRQIRTLKARKKKARKKMAALSHWKSLFGKKHKKNPADYYYAFIPVGPKKPAFVSRDGQKWKTISGQSKRMLLSGFRKRKIKHVIRSAYIDGTPHKGRLYKFLIVDTLGPSTRTK